VSLDTRVIALMAAACGVIALVFSFVPVLQSRTTSVLSMLKAEASRTGSGSADRAFARSVLVVGEIALAVVLVISAGLLIKSFWMLRAVDAGFDPRGVAKAEFQLPASRYASNFSQFPNFVEIHRFNRALLERVTALPGVHSAAIAGNHPLDAGFTNSFTVVGREVESRDWPEISTRRVSPGYFRTVGVPLLRGRLFTDSDGTFAAPVAIINAETQRRFFAGRDPIGAQIRMYGAARTIVGVVGNERIHGLDDPEPIAVYFSLAQVAFGDGVVLARTAGDAEALAGSLRAAVRDIDPALAVFGVQTLDETVAHSVAERQFTMMLMTGFGVLALALAVIGIHGLLSYTVAQRTRELGIRVALGAAPDAIVGMVVGQSLKLTMIGVAAGLGLAVLAGHWLAGLLFGVTSRDLWIFSGVVVLLVAVSMLATLIPALRATRVSAIVALRYE
jgi:predicted permease